MDDSQRSIMQLKTRSRPAEYLKRFGQDRFVFTSEIARSCNLTSREVAGLLKHDENIQSVKVSDKGRAHRWVGTVGRISDDDGRIMKIAGLKNIKKSDRPLEYLRRKGIGVWVNAKDIAYECDISRAEVTSGLCGVEGVELKIMRNNTRDTLYRLVFDNQTSE